MFKKELHFMSIDVNYLLELLETYFSNKIPRNKNITIEEVRVIQGQQEVLDYLKGILEKEERNRNAATKPKPAKG